MNKALFLSAILFSSTCLASASNVLKGSDMSTASSSSWTTSTLNSPESGSIHVATWGETAFVPEGTTQALMVEAPVNTVGTSQFSIYQEVDLTGGTTYELTGNYIWESMENGWCEMFIGKDAPTDGNDYSSGEGIIVMAKFSHWDVVPKTGDFTDSIPENLKNTFKPEADGKYYFVVKFGNFNNENPYKVALSNLSLHPKVAPTANFEWNAIVGYAGATEFNFIDKTDVTPDSWLWNFGDGNTSSEQNPTHTYATEGTYTVTLTVEKAGGSNMITKENLIKVNKLTVLDASSADNVLKEGNMQVEPNDNGWAVSTLSSPADGAPILVWNQTGNNSAAGKDGYLQVDNTDVAANTMNANSQVAIYQKVTLSTDKQYVFDGVFRNLTMHNFHSFYLEVYVSTEAPVVGADFNSGTVVAKINTWDNGTLYQQADGSFSLIGAKFEPYIPASNGEYYVVVKIGTWSNVEGFSIVLDELSFTGYDSEPIVDFVSDISCEVGTNVAVTFTNNTNFGKSYVWNFGDGNTSTEVNPTHTYAAAGRYTVSLAATNAMGTTTVTKTDYIVVASSVTPPAGEVIYGEMDMSCGWDIISLNDREQLPNIVWNNTANLPKKATKSAEISVTAGGNYAIMQNVVLKKDYQYDFKGFYKSVGLNNTWIECFLLPEALAPVAGSDVSGEAVAPYLIAKIDSWNSENGGVADTLIQEYAMNYKPLRAQADGNYIFVIKFGGWGDFAFQLAHLQLTETLVAAADFMAMETTGDAPFTTDFFDMSDDSANEWAWDFGDGGTSNEQFPRYTYNKPGTYTVKLTVSNGQTEDTETKEDYIVVTGEDPTSIDAPMMEKYRIFVTNGVINIENVEKSVEIYNLAGVAIQQQICNGTFTSQQLQNGIYIVKIDGKTVKVAVR